MGGILPFSNQILDNCTVLRIHDLFPKKIRLSETNSTLNDGFLFLAFSESKPLVYHNLGFEPTEAEASNLKKYLSMWGAGNEINIRNGILEMSVPTFLNPFLEEINKIPGCRVSPNLLRIEGDVYFSIEYSHAVNWQVSDAVMTFLSQNHIFLKELVYTGANNAKIPFLINLYRNKGNDLDNLFLIRTTWKIKEEDKQNQNQGFFQNTGSYVPKFFIDGSSDKLIFKSDTDEIKGEGVIETVDEAGKLFEVEIRSAFFSDFYNEVIRQYSGPIFVTMQITNGYQISSYIVERQYQGLFVRGLLKHWRREARSDHMNYISAADGLNSILENNVWGIQ